MLIQRCLNVSAKFSSILWYPPLSTYYRSKIHTLLTALSHANKSIEECSLNIISFILQPCCSSPYKQFYFMPIENINIVLNTSTAASIHSINPTHLVHFRQHLVTQDIISKASYFLFCIKSFLYSPA